MWSNAKLLRMLTVGVSVAALALLWAWLAAAQASRNVNWSSDLHLKSLADIANRLCQPVSTKYEPHTPLKLILTNGKAFREIGSCEEYLNAVSAGFYAGDNFANKMSGSFVCQCYALRDLQQARRATSSNSYAWSKDSLAQLPPLLVVGAREITDAAEQAEKQGKSWQQFNSTLKITDVSRDELGAEDQDFAYSLEILARGDFNGDGVKDIAVYGTATGKHSSWASTEYFIFSPTNTGKLVRLTDDVAPYKIKGAAPVV